MNNIEEKLHIIQQKLSVEISTQMLFDILFEMNRYFDKQFVAQIHDGGLNLNQSERNNLRKYYYYTIHDFLIKTGVKNFKGYIASENDKISVLNSCIERCEKYDEKKIIKSIEERFKTYSSVNIADNSKDWLSYYDTKRKNLYDFSLFILDYSQADFIDHNYNVSNIFKIIADIYDRLENYRYFVFKLQGKLFNKNNEDVTWKVLYKIGIYCENFIEFSDTFSPFKKDTQIDKLTFFLDSRFEHNNNNRTLAEQFYSSISTGFKFEDCLVSDTQDNIILTFQKIKLDQSEIPCPACMSTIQNGNSYPQLFLRSFECKNPSCKERSKSGRGKRFDEYGTYRYFKLVQNNLENFIDSDMFSKWRKDVFSNDCDIYEMLIKYYSWDNENILITKDITNLNKFCRNIYLYTSYNTNKYNTEFEKLPIYSLLNSISKIISIKNGTKILQEKYCIYNEDSAEYLQKLKPEQIGTAITSPPYYNAREYSQWSNLLFYLIDMQRNCKAVYDTIINSGYYLYNIGDVVGADNIYVSSNMSKRRLQLGFLSSMVFEICGFNLVGNIIWNKGEVQSKRNSTMNHYSGYIKLINCYEHFLVFKKGIENKSVGSVENITPVIKINSKGENLAKHTAPYPLELVALAKPFICTGKYVLDPFLGSGTTLKWCINHNYNGVGFEIDSEYFKLALKNIHDYTKKED